MNRVGELVPRRPKKRGGGQSLSGNCTGKAPLSLIVARLNRVPDKREHESHRLTAEQYMRLAEIAFGQAKATLSPKASKAFFEVGKDYLAQAKAIDPTIPDSEF